MTELKVAQTKIRDLQQLCASHKAEVCLILLVSFLGRGVLENPFAGVIDFIVQDNQGSRGLSFEAVEREGGNKMQQKSVDEVLW